MQRIFIYSLALCLTGAWSASSQPVMTSNDLLGAPGTTVRAYHTADLVTVDVGPSGANQTWDFSAMIATEENIEHWVDPSTTPYAATFPLANRCMYDETDPQVVYNYFQLTTNAYWTLGYGMEILQIVFSNPKAVMEFPATYLDEWDTVYDYDMGFGTTVYDSAHNVIDAWGTVIDGNNTYTNVLRIRSHRTTITSVMGFPVSTFIWYIYSWHDVEEGPVASINSDLGETNPNFTVGYFGRVDEVTGVQELPGQTALPTDITLEPAFPNPFNPETQLTFSLPVAGDAVLAVYDLQGREVSRLHDGWLQAGTYRSVFTADHLAGGIYLARLTAGNYQGTQKLVLIK